MAGRIYDKVTERVAAIDVTNVKESVRGSFQNASEKLSTYWQDLQVLYLGNTNPYIYRQNIIQVEDRPGSYLLNKALL
jgi:hypothetical protein